MWEEVDLSGDLDMVHRGKSSRSWYADEIFLPAPTELGARLGPRCRGDGTHQRDGVLSYIDILWLLMSNISSALPSSLSGLRLFHADVHLIPRGRLKNS